MSASGSQCKRATLAQTQSSKLHPGPSSQSSAAPRPLSKFFVSSSHALGLLWAHASGALDVFNSVEGDSCPTRSIAKTTVCSRRPTSLMVSKQVSLVLRTVPRPGYSRYHVQRHPRSLRGVHFAQFSMVMGGMIGLWHDTSIRRPSFKHLLE